MDEKIIKEITSRQIKIDELKELKSIIIDSVDDKAEVIIKTTHLGIYLNVHFFKRKSKLNLSTNTLIALLNTAIENERSVIDNLINNEVAHRVNK